MAKSKMKTAASVDRPDWRQQMVATKSRLVYSVGTFCASLAVGALAVSNWDDGPVNDGKWNARIDGDARTARQGRVEIADFAGQWREIGPRREGDPCRGTKPFPITVQRSNNKELEFTVWAEQVSKCPDFALTLQVVDERTLVGTMQLVKELPPDGSTSGGPAVRLIREPDKGRAQR
jgi:hypothetical protein